jgi:hypothetical protein
MTTWVVAKKRSVEGKGGIVVPLNSKYQFLCSHCEYLFVTPFLKVPCPQTMVSIATVA